MPTDYRKLAKGKPCLVRLPGCNGNRETTILAHYRLSGYCGVGMKPDDVAFVDELPHTATGKIAKRVLRQRFEDYVMPDDRQTAGED